MSTKYPRPAPLPDPGLPALPEKILAAAFLAEDVYGAGAGAILVREWTRSTWRGRWYRFRALLLLAFRRARRA